MKALGIFEGGGVRGYAHVGALKACEERGIELTGLAGTSIGAIVAVLVAAGYCADELYRVDDGGRETGLFACDVEADFLDRGEYERVLRAAAWWRTAGTLKKSLGARISSNAVVRRLTARLASAHASAWENHLEYALGSTSSLSPVAALAAARHWPLLRAMWSRAGALSAARFTEWLDARLRERLGKAAGEPVTFADIEMPLVLISANLSQQRMTLFQRATHPDLPLAAAAMASAAYPFFFKPQILMGEAFVDGGLVSNFPAWALDDLRARLPATVPTFGFRVVDAPSSDASAIWPAKDAIQALQTVRRIAATATFGRGVLESRRIDDLHPIEVVTDIKATDFHLVTRKRADLYRSGRDQVSRYFADHLGPRDPIAMTIRLRRCLDVVRDVTSAQGRVRAYLVQPVDDVFARIVHSALYEGDADDSLSLRRDATNQASCIAMREPILMRTVELDDAQRRSPANKYVHALRPSSVTHAYCIPMFDDPDDWTEADPGARREPLAAFCVDFDLADDRLLLETAIEDALAAVADAFVDCWKERPRRDPSLSNFSDQPPAGDWTPLQLARGYYVSSRKVRRPPPAVLEARIAKATS